MGTIVIILFLSAADGMERESRKELTFWNETRLERNSHFGTRQVCIGTHILGDMFAARKVDYFFSFKIFV